MLEEQEEPGAAIVAAAAANDNPRADGRECEEKPQQPLDDDNDDADSALDAAIAREERWIRLYQAELALVQKQQQEEKEEDHENDILSMLMDNNNNNINNYGFLFGSSGSGGAAEQDTRPPHWIGSCSSTAVTRIHTRASPICCDPYRHYEQINNSNNNDNRNNASLLGGRLQPLLRNFCFTSVEHETKGRELRLPGGEKDAAAAADRHHAYTFHGYFLVNRSVHAVIRMVILLDPSSSSTSSTASTTSQTKNNNNKGKNKPRLRIGDIQCSLVSSKQPTTTENNTSSGSPTTTAAADKKKTGRGWSSKWRPWCGWHPVGARTTLRSGSASSASSWNLTSIAVPVWKTSNRASSAVVPSNCRSSTPTANRSCGFPSTIPILVAIIIGIDDNDKDAISETTIPMHPMVPKQ